MVFVVKGVTLAFEGLGAEGATMLRWPIEPLEAHSQCAFVTTS
jgi:hypothetical protein